MSKHCKGRGFTARGLLLAHNRGLEGLAGLIVRNPLADLLAILEVPGAHSCAAFAEPLPITVHLALLHPALAIHRSICVIVHMLGDFALCRHEEISFVRCGCYQAVGSIGKRSSSN